MANVAVLEGLRARLCEVEARHEADGRAAAEAFWSTLGAGADDAGPGAAARRRGRGVRGCVSGRPAGGGLWAHVPADEPLPFLPREVESVELSELDLDGADADWFEANYPGPAEPEFAEPVEVKVDALLGRPLVRHGSDLLAHAVGHLAGLRAQHEVMLVNVLAELQDRGETPPGGLRVVDWLRSLDPSLTAGQAKDFVTVARGGDPAAVGRAGRAGHDAARHGGQGGPDHRVRAAHRAGRRPGRGRHRGGGSGRPGAGADPGGLHRAGAPPHRAGPPTQGRRRRSPGRGPPRQPRALVRPALEHRDGLAARRCWTRRPRP